MNDKADDPWRIDEADYPATASAPETLRFLLRYAVLAPSSHNTQPWLFRVSDGRLELHADRRRALPVVDPEDRELTISCGAALGVLRTAMQRFGHEGRVDLLPDAADADLLARVELGAPHKADAGDRARFDAITARRSTRIAFEDRPLPAGLTGELPALAAAEDVELALLTDRDDRAKVAALVAEGDRVQHADRSFRRELAAWIHSRRSESRDGMSLASFGAPDLASGAGAALIRSFDLGGRLASTDEDLAAGSPALLVVATPGDGPRDWLVMGMAHVQLLLAITAAGLTAAYLNQPVEVAGLRDRLREAAGVEGVPQLLLRIGEGPSVPPSVRRPLDEVMLA